MKDDDVVDLLLIQLTVLHKCGMLQDRRVFGYFVDIRVQLRVLHWIVIIIIFTLDHLMDELLVG